MGFDTAAETLDILLPMADAGEAWWHDFSNHSTSHTPAHHPTMPKVQFAEEFIRDCGGKILDAEHYPEFTKAVHEMADKLNLGYKPVIGVAKNIPIGMAFMHHLPNAAGFPEEGIVIANEALLKMTGDHISHAPSNKIKSLFAHELSHLKYDAGGQIAALHHSGYLLPIAAMAGLAIFDKARANKKHTTFASMHQEVQKVADGLEASLEEHSKDKDKEWKPEMKAYRPLIQLGRYTAAAMVGLGASLLLKRHVSLSREFHADKVAVELVKDAEAFKTVLKDMTHAHEKALIEFIDDLMKQVKNKDNPISLMDALIMIKNDVSMLTTHAHPSLPKRLAHIESVAANMSAHAKNATQTAAALL